MLDSFAAKSAVLAARIRARERNLIRDLVSRVRISPAAIEVECSVAAIAEATQLDIYDDAAPTVTLRQPMRLTRSGMAMRMVQGGRAVGATPDQALVRLIVKARGYWQELRKGQLNVTELAEREKISGAYVTRVLRLAFLSPAGVDAILDGKQPAALNSVALLLKSEVSGDWRRQATTLFAANG